MSKMNPTRSELSRLRAFAKMLNWPGLSEFTHTVKNSGDSRLDGQVIRWYESGSIDDILFQINRAPRFHVAVYAIRYRICSGWHKFSLFESVKQQQQEAQRLEQWLGRRWFTSLELRRQFRKLHPECTGYTYTKLRTVGTPCDQDT